MKLGILLAGLLCVEALGQVQPPVPGSPDTITIVGPVRKPGTYTFKAQLTVMRIVAISGGFERNADQRKVQIVRLNSNTPIDVDVQSIGTGKLPDITLEPGDTIYVPARLDPQRPQRLGEPTKTDFLKLPIA